MIDIIPCVVVYKSTAANKTFVTIRAAIHAEARALIKAKHPTEKGDASIGDYGFHWRELDRSDVLLRRLIRLIKNRR